MNWLKSKKIIITHSGNFHADEIFSIATLSLYLNRRIKIIRTRDLSILSKGDYVLDVGQIYDPASNRFDHHQIDGGGKRENGVPYATFGLLWKEYGKKICSSDKVADLVDQKLVQSIDAHDNGFLLSQKKVFGISDYDISDYIHSVNAVCDSREHGKIFRELISLAKKVLLIEIKYIEQMVKDQVLIVEAYNSAVNKKIIVLDFNCSDLSILSDYSEPVFVIKPNFELGHWKIYTVKEKENPQKNRLSLPVEWVGKNSDELANLTGIPDAIYSDHRLFMAIAKSKQGAIKLAELALAQIKK